MIRFSFDPDDDVMFAWLAPEDTKSVTMEEVACDMLLDFDAAGNVGGIEILGVRERVAERGDRAG